MSAPATTPTCLMSSPSTMGRRVTTSWAVPSRRERSSIRHHALCPGGAADPVYGPGQQHRGGYVRDPFGHGLRIAHRPLPLPAARSQPASGANARDRPERSSNPEPVPAPNSELQVYGNSPALYEHKTQRHARDYNPSQTDQIFCPLQLLRRSDLHSGHLWRHR